MFSGVCIFCGKFHDVENVRALICGHLFHHTCISVWLEENPWCPTCRQKTESTIQLYATPLVDKPPNDAVGKPTTLKSGLDPLIPFTTFTAFVDLENACWEAIQKTWDSKLMSQWNCKSVFEMMGKSFYWSAKAIKSNKIFEGYYFLLRARYFIDELEKTSDYDLYFRNHSVPINQLTDDIFDVLEAFETTINFIYADPTNTGEALVKAFEKCNTLKTQQNKKLKFYVSM